MSPEVKKLRLELRNKDDEIRGLMDENERLRALVWYWQERNRNLEWDILDLKKEVLNAKQSGD